MSLDSLDEKIVQTFPGLIVRKDLASKLKGAYPIPTYVLEFLLGRYCSSPDPEVIEHGMKKVRDLLEEHYIDPEKVEIVYDRREYLWFNSLVRDWWEHKSFFGPRHITIKDLWRLVQAIGQIIQFNTSIDKDKEKNWKKFQSLAWKLETAYTMINQHQHNIDFTTLAALSFLSPFLKKAIAAYETVQDKLNELFSHLYVTYLGNSDFPLASTSAKKMLDHGIKELSANKNVAFLFLDALRLNIAIELKIRIDEMMDKNKRNFSSSKVTPTQAYSLLPSTTGIGWPSILAHDLQVEYAINRQQNEKVKVEINLTNGSNSLHLYSSGERNKRLLTILKQSQQPINLFELDSSNVQKIVASYRKKAISAKYRLVPVLWFRKFDDHNQNRYEFYSSLDSSLNQLVQIVYQLHLIGIDHIYMFTDHGFTFSQNSQKLEDIPKEELQSRYCYSVAEFTDLEKKKFNDWYFWYPGQISGVSSSDNNLMIITPKLNRIFKKIRQKERFVHGGLTFQECDIQFLQSSVVLVPKVTIASIEYVKHQIETNYVQQEVIILREGKADKFLDLKVHATQTSLHAPSLQPIRIRVTTDVDNITVKPAGEKTLKAGGAVLFKLYFSDFSIE